MRPSHNNRKKSRRRVSRTSSSVASGNDFDITNNAFASAILEDDFSEVGSGVQMREELVNSIMTHEAAVYDEQQSQVLDIDPSKVSRARESFTEKGTHPPAAPPRANDGDNFSFRPYDASLPHPGSMMDESVSAEHSVANSIRSGQSVRSSRSSQSRPSVKLPPHPSRSRSPQPPPPQQSMPPRKGSFSSLASKSSSYIASGLSTIKGQVSEIDKALLHRAESEKSSGNYSFPVPKLPHESRKAGILRLVIAIICLILAMTITLVWGQGKFGHASATFFYNSFVLNNERGDRPHILNDETTKDGSHLFEKVKTLERGFRANAFGNPEKHLPIVVLDNEGNIEVSAPKDMAKTIEFIWVKEVVSNQVVLARHYNSDETPKLRAKVPLGVKLQPYLFCHLHELWVGEEFEVV